MSSTSSSGDVLTMRMAAARRHVIDYGRLMDPRFLPARHLDLIGEHLEALERREFRKLCVSMPPRCGKTKLISQLFASWWRGRHPQDDIVLASYGGELAEENSRAVQTLIRDENYPFDVRIRKDSSSVARWETTAGGHVIAAGVGTGLTGRGYHLGIGDDLVKDRVEAESAAIRKSTRDWYEDVFSTRAAPDAVQVMVGTRWHEDDVMGSLVNRPGWVFLNLPMFAEEDDVLGRAEGELLWPERFGPEDFPSVERGEISSRSFSALYQQRPAPASGNIFKRQWFENRYEGGIPNFTITERGDEIWPGVYGTVIEKPGQVHIIQAVDAASKTGEMNDWSVISTIACDGVDYFVVDVVRQRLEFSGLLSALLEAYRKWNPSYVFIELASSGIALEQEIRRTTRLPISGITPKDSKIARATAMTNLFECGKVKFPQRAPWLEQLIEEFSSFPFAAHDDVVDSVILGLTRIDDVVAQWQWDSAPNRRNFGR